MAATPTGAGPAGRLASLDVLRGIVMLLMAVDHVRLYTSGAPFDPLDIARTTPWYYLTRWITHFCAPVFVFLAGTGAYLHGRAGSRATLARYLFTRGLVLILIEQTIVRWAWTFNLDYAHYVFFGVISTIGACLIALSAVAWLPVGAVAVIGVLLVAGHNLLDARMAELAPAIRASAWRWAWSLFYQGGAIPIGETGSRLLVLFALTPWIGVTCSGYAFGWVAARPADERRRWCVGLGAAAAALFLGLRAGNLYGNPRPWTPQADVMRSVFSFFNTAKYPASLQFLTMTLGPALALLPWLERLPARVVGVLAVFGRVPLFYYVLHLFAAHLAAVAVSLTTQGTVAPWLFGNHPMMAGLPPDGWGVRLLVVWAMTLAIWFVLYWPCRWLAALKDRRGRGWLSWV